MSEQELYSSDLELLDSTNDEVTGKMVNLWKLDDKLFVVAVYFAGMQYGKYYWSQDQAWDQYATLKQALEEGCISFLEQEWQKYEVTIIASY